ncbi:hypothetical protein EIP91_007385 [Steccherinum ochraceum]|uniref:Uncharacterized protein n=1 Tax=Steccherinum ochraceum TaxID=92696 RepID=A0A4R0S2B1_9APHY|nr:hypothetical protein EIP91_007385 [Steccherinum ochraceum]
MTSMLKTHFEGHVFPQVRTVILPNCAHNVLRSCPEVRSVTCNEHDGGKLIAPIGSSCKKVETLVNIRPSAAIIKRLIKAAPQLKELEINAIAEAAVGYSWKTQKEWTVYSPADIRALSALKNLKTITLVVGKDGEKARTSKEHEDAARDVLAASKAGEGKVLFVRYCTHGDSHWSRDNDRESKRIAVP